MTLIEIGYILLLLMCALMLTITHLLTQRPISKHKHLRAFICPYNNKIECPYIDTSGMSKTKECVDCENFKKKKVRINLK